MNELFLLQLEDYINKHYERSCCEEQVNEYFSLRMNNASRLDHDVAEQFGEEATVEDFDLSQFTKANFPDFIKRLEENKPDIIENPKEEIVQMDGCICPPPDACYQRPAYRMPEEAELKAYLHKTKNEETFSTMLLKYIDQTGLSDAAIYKRAGIDRRHFSKIRCDKEYQPKKTTAIALCLALRLQLEQVNEMLTVAGYSLSNSDIGDLIIRFCIEKGKYDLMEVNEALVYFGEKAIGVV